MKRLFLNFMVCTAMVSALALTSCGDDNEGDGNGGDGSSIVFNGNTLTGSLTGKETLEAKEYILSGIVVIENGGELTIPAGTTIKARQGFSNYLLVAQGGKIYANGTKDEPIIFTADEDNAKSGHWEVSSSMVKLLFRVIRKTKVIRLWPRSIINILMEVTMLPTTRV